MPLDRLHDGIPLTHRCSGNAFVGTCKRLPEASREQDVSSSDTVMRNAPTVGHLRRPPPCLFFLSAFFLCLHALVVTVRVVADRSYPRKRQGVDRLRG